MVLFSLLILWDIVNTFLLNYHWANFDLDKYLFKIE